MIAFVCMSVHLWHDMHIHRPQNNFYWVASDSLLSRHMCSPGYSELHTQITEACGLWSSQYLYKYSHCPGIRLDCRLFALQVSECASIQALTSDVIQHDRQQFCPLIWCKSYCTYKGYVCVHTMWGNTCLYSHGWIRLPCSVYDCIY